MSDTGKVRFIRRGGRVIPIRGKNERISKAQQENHLRKSNIANAVGGASLAGTLAMAREVAIHSGRSKLFKRSGQHLKSVASSQVAKKYAKVALGSYGVMAASAVYGTVQSFKARKGPKTTFGEDLKSTGKGLGSYIGGAAVVGLGYGGLLSGGGKLAKFLKARSTAKAAAAASESVRRSGLKFGGLLKGRK